jgi:hypothetical protein
MRGMCKSLPDEALSNYAKKVKKTGRSMWHVPIAIREVQHEELVKLPV